MIWSVQICVISDNMTYDLTLIKISLTLCVLLELDVHMYKGTFQNFLSLIMCLSYVIILMNTSCLLLWSRTVHSLMSVSATAYEHLHVQFYKSWYTNGSVDKCRIDGDGLIKHASTRIYIPSKLFSHSITEHSYWWVFFI